VSPERLARHIAWLHQLEPPGIGARDIRECLLLQCTDLEARGFDCKAARQILSAAWEPFVNQRWASVAKLTGLAHQDIEAARQFMHDNLYPYPLLMVPDVADDNDQLAYPDLVIRHTDGTGRFTVEVPAAHAYQLTINPAFRMVTHTEGVTDSALVAHEHEWIAQSIERARTFIHALDQRYTTLRRIGEFLVEYQSDFLQRGPKYLRPLTRSEAARQLDLHESTLSRAVSDKVVQLPGGKLIELDDLFDGSLAAKAVLRELVNSDGTLSDRELALRLQSASFNLSRRTVAKYRAQLRIPAHGRRKPERAIKNTPS
jgi:RNA polymerase sigma-54 factor